MLNTLRQIVEDVTSEASFPEALKIMVRHVKAALGTEVCSVYLKNRTGDRFRFAATEGLNEDAVGVASLAVDEGLVGLVASRAEPINLDDASSHPSFHHVPEVGEEVFNAFLGVPIIHQRKVLGVMIVQQRDQRRFDESHEAFLVTLSALLANVIAHAEATGAIDQLTQRQVEPRFDTKFKGVPGAPGIAHGTAVVAHPMANLDAVPEREVENVTVEIAVFDRAVATVRRDIEKIGEQFQGSLAPEELALFDAYLHMLDDNALAGDMRERIRRGQWAQGAIKQVIREHLKRFEQMEDPYLRERGADVKDLGLRVLACLQDFREKKTLFPRDTILVGDEVTPSMLANIPTDRLSAIVSVRGSGNSHVAILARALGVPAVMGAVDLPLYGVEGETLVVDGFYGEVFLNPSPQRIRDNEQLMEQEREFAVELDELKNQPCFTLDGWRMRLWANIGLTSEIHTSLDRGAEGIGLFRTEIPFMTKDRFPTEEEQRVLYKEQMDAFATREVTMRTLDIGGDKALPYFPIAEDNPFLGWRGIRVTLDHPEIFMVQVRAMIKASEDFNGTLRIMLPMISNLGEVDEASAMIERAYCEVVEEGTKVNRPLVGVMIEVPSAVYQARQLARRVDFLAVGSNDLTQYMLAVDRNNPRVAGLYHDVHPAVLAALREVARAAHSELKGIGICGELAGTPIGAVLLMAMGYNVLSMNAANLPKVKWVLRNVKRAHARRMLARVLRMDTVDEIQDYMRKQLIDLGLSRALPTHDH